MSIPISDSLISCKLVGEESLTSSQLTLSCTFQSFFTEATSCSALFSLAVGQGFAAVVQAQGFRLLSPLFNPKMSRILSTSASWITEGVAFNTASELGRSGEFRIGPLNENIHGIATIAVCKVMGRGILAHNAVVRNLVQNSALMTVDLSFEECGWIEKRNFSLTERFFNCQLTSFRMEISASFLASSCPQISIFKAEQELDYELRKPTESQHGSEGKKRFFDPLYEMFSPKFLSANGAFLENIREATQTEQLKKSLQFFSKGDDADDAIALLNQVYPGRPSEVRRVLSQLRMLQEPPSEPVKRKIIPYIDPKWLGGFHKTVDQFLKGKPTLSVDEQEAFRLLAEYTTVLTGGESDSTTLSLLYDRSFPRLKNYFLALTRIAQDKMEYAVKTDPRDEPPHDIPERLFAIRTVLASYLAIRTENSQGCLIDQISKAVRKTLNPIYANELPIWIDYHQMALDFMMRRIASDQSLMAVHGNLIREHFPLVDYYREGEKNRISWEEIESIRRAHLPTTLTKPTLMIVGIGAEYEQVERYAKAGYQLVLVDHSKQVTDFFEQKREALHQLELQNGVRIRFFSTNIEDFDLSEFIGSIDCIEYQNAKGIQSYQEMSIIGKLLKQGGLFVQFNPLPITFPEDPVDQAFRWRESNGQYGTPFKNYRTILDKKNIPAVLGTTSERLVYPVGNYLFMVQKPGDGNISAQADNHLKPSSLIRIAEATDIQTVSKIAATLKLNPHNPDPEKLKRGFLIYTLSPEQYLARLNDFFFVSARSGIPNGFMMGYDRDFLKRLLDNGAVAHEDGIMDFIFRNESDNFVFIDQIAIDPETGTKGTGIYLLRRATTLMKERKIQRMYGAVLHAPVKNEVASALNSRLASQIGEVLNKDGLTWGIYRWDLNFSE